MGLGSLLTKNVARWLEGTSLPRSVAAVRTGKTFGGSVTKHVAFNLAVPTAMTYFSSSPEERMGAATKTAASSLLFLGMHPGKAFLATTALGMAPLLGSGVRGIYNTNRNTLESRSMASIPFSYSQQSIDFVGANYQMSRMQDGKSATVGNEAQFLSSRYMSR